MYPRPAPWAIIFRPSGLANEAFSRWIYRLCRRCFLRNSGFFALLEEGHHRAQLGADALDRLILGRLAHSQEVLASAAVFGKPGAREFHALDLAQDLLHLGTSLRVDDARATRVVAILSRIGNRITHVAEAALINQVDDQL